VAFAKGFTRQEVIDHDSVITPDLFYEDSDSQEDPEALKKASASDEKAVQIEFQCGYCNAIKVSMSTGGDSYVRIRCKCGGKHGDNKVRMHARRKMLGPVGHS
jgi:hypothetical protein